MLSVANFPKDTYKLHRLYRIRDKAWPMKIEQNDIPSSLVKAQKNDSVDAKASQDGASKSSQSGNVTQDSEQMRNRMMQWFSRAGILPKGKSLLDQEPAKVAARHKFIKLQRKIKNLENIMGMALKYSIEQSTPEELDPDWFFSFVDMAEDINAPAMQELWGKIFSVELGAPGSFSIRTLDALRKLTHKDAKTLKNAVGLASRKKGEHGLKILIGYHQQAHFFSIFRPAKNTHLNLAKYGLSYPDLLSLMDMGLIFSTELETGELPTNSSSEYRCSGETYMISPKTHGLTLNYYKFTSTGAELAKLVHGKTKTPYLAELKMLFAQGFSVN